MVTRSGIVIMLGQLERSGVMRPFRARGVTIAGDICDQPYGCRDFDVEDCNGYRLCFGQDLVGG